MAANVEARSLSELNHIAANPPRYPRNPTEPKREPLVLYISRVPATSDIILTTLRPQLKNVTATDVENSLYYIHLNSPEELLAEARKNVGGLASSPSVRTIQRKPVGDQKLHASPVDGPQNEASATRPLVAPMVDGKSLARKPLPLSSGPSQIFVDRVPGPVGVSNSPEPSPTAVHSAAAHSPDRTDTGILRSDLSASGSTQLQDSTDVLRKPIGPRPMNTVQKEISDANPRDLAVKPVLRNRSGSQSHAEEHIEPHTEQDEKSFTITIIRRDPTSGGQWNIGKVEGKSTTKERPGISTKVVPLARKLQYDMSVNISNPAYTYFRGMQKPQGATVQTPTGHSHDTRSIGQEARPANTSGYTAEIRMEGVDFWSNTKQRARAMSDLANTLGATGLAPPERQSAFHDQNDGIKRGYAFDSIWNGRCKFTTGASGRSLRCSHTIPGHQATISSGDGSVAVSDLRFNLPLGVDLSKEALVARSKNLQNISDQLRSKLMTYDAPWRAKSRPTEDTGAEASNPDARRIDAAPLPLRSHANDSDDASSDDDYSETPACAASTKHKAQEDRARLDLSIGQEAAGGGNRGKRAKLGKLIIHNEGFKMLDLIVAANMGVWWSVWNPDP